MFNARIATARRPTTRRNPDDPTVVPQVEIAATVCGGCHSASPVAHSNNAPTFEEWSAGGHGAVVPGALKA